jgi:hypothetical protein
MLYRNGARRAKEAQGKMPEKNSYRMRVMFRMHRDHASFLQENHLPFR